MHELGRTFSDSLHSAVVKKAKLRFFGDKKCQRDSRTNLPGRARDSIVPVGISVDQKPDRHDFFFVSTAESNRTAMPTY